MLKIYIKEIKKYLDYNLLNHIKNIDELLIWKSKKKLVDLILLIFFSKDMIITKKSLNENQLKLTYQKQLLSDLDDKHKEWSKSIESKF